MNAENKTSIGQAVDQVMGALKSLDKREQEIVIGAICSLLEIDSNAKGAGKTHGHGANLASTLSSGSPNRSDNVTDTTNPATNGGQRATPTSIDIRTLKEQKQPANVLQMACVVAFYLQEHAPAEEQTKEVTAADLERLFKQAGYKLPSRMQQVLVDAKGAGYFESVQRGKYKLTRVGYNLVTHSLPRVATK